MWADKTAGIVHPERIHVLLATHNKKFVSIINERMALLATKEYNKDKRDRDGIEADEPKHSSNRTDKTHGMLRYIWLNLLLQLQK